MGSRSAWKTCIFKVLWPVATVLLIASPCPSRAALTPSEATCRQRVGSVGRGLLRDLQKAITKCRDRVSKGALPAMTDCSVEPGTASRIAKVEGQVGTKIAAACADPVVAQLVFGGACYGSATAADLASCLVDTHEEQAFALADVVYGSTGSLPDAQQACQAAVSKQGKKFVVKRHKQITQLQGPGRSRHARTDHRLWRRGRHRRQSRRRQRGHQDRRQVPRRDRPDHRLRQALHRRHHRRRARRVPLGQHTDRDDTLIAVEYGSGASGTTALAKQITDPVDRVREGPAQPLPRRRLPARQRPHPRRRPGPAAQPVRHRPVRRPDHRRRPGAHAARPRARQLRGVVDLDQHREHRALHRADQSSTTAATARPAVHPRHRRRRPARLRQPEHGRRRLRLRPSRRRPTTPTCRSRCRPTTSSSPARNWVRVETTVHEHRRQRRSASSSASS